MSRYQSMLNFLFVSDKIKVVFLSCFFAFFAVIIIDGGAVSKSISMAFEPSPTIFGNETVAGSKLIYETIPSNVSIHVEPKDTGTLYLSALIFNDTVDIFRDLNDELFPFQVVNWYQLIKLEPRYKESSAFENFTNSDLAVGQLQDFDNFDNLLEQARLYNNIPLNETFILDVPNRDVSFILLKIDFTDGESAIYYGLYDGNQQPKDKSEVNLRLNPKSSLKMPESESATEIKNDDLLFNITKTFVCNDLYKLGYEKCQ